MTTKAVARATREIMPATLSTGRATFKYETVPAVPTAREAHVAPVFDILAAVGFSSTAAGAKAKADRGMNDVLLTVAAAIKRGDGAWTDQYCAKLDELREAGMTVELSAAALHTIQSADSAEDCARIRYHTEPSADTARALIHAGLKQIRTTFELIRGLRTKYAELAR